MGREINLEKSWRFYNPTPQLNGLDLDGKDWIVTIDHFKEEKVSAEPKEKLVAYFKERIIEGEQKGMICGATVSKVLTKLAGGKDGLKHWVGLTIQIFPTTDRDKDVVRVRPFLPKIQEEPKEKPVLAIGKKAYLQLCDRLYNEETTLEKAREFFTITDEVQRAIELEIKAREAAENA